MVAYYAFGLVNKGNEPGWAVLIFPPKIWEIESLSDLAQSVDIGITEDSRAIVRYITNLFKEGINIKKENFSIIQT